MPGNMFVPVDLLRPILAELRSTRHLVGEPARLAGHELRRAGRRACACCASTTTARPTWPGCRPATASCAIDGAAVSTLDALWKALWRGGPPEREVSLEIERGGGEQTLKCCTRRPRQDAQALAGRLGRLQPQRRRSAGPPRVGIAQRSRSSRFRRWLSSRRDSLMKLSCSGVSRSRARVARAARGARGRPQQSATRSKWSPIVQRAVVADVDRRAAAAARHSAATQARARSSAWMWLVYTSSSRRQHRRAAPHALARVAAGAVERRRCRARAARCTVTPKRAAEVRARAPRHRRGAARGRCAGARRARLVERARRRSRRRRRWCWRRPGAARAPPRASARSSAAVRGSVDALRRRRRQVQHAHRPARARRAQRGGVVEVAHQRHGAGRAQRGAALRRSRSAPARASARRSRRSTRRPMSPQPTISSVGRRSGERLRGHRCKVMRADAGAGTIAAHQCRARQRASARTRP